MCSKKDTGVMSSVGDKTTQRLCEDGPVVVFAFAFAGPTNAMSGEVSHLVGRLLHVGAPA